MGSKYRSSSEDEERKVSRKPDLKEMRIVRSSKCSLKFLTEFKRQELVTILDEYGRVVNWFIDMFWKAPIPKTKLLKDVVNIPESWLSARLRKVAAREALDMIFAAKKRWRKRPEKMVKPIHRCRLQT